MNPNTNGNPKSRVKTLTKKDIEMKIVQKFEGKKLTEKAVVDALFDSIRELTTFSTARDSIPSLEHSLSML